MPKTGTRLSLLDLAAALLILAGVAYTLHRIQVDMSYTWNWAAIPQFLFRWDPETRSWTANLLMEGFFTTLRLSVWGSLLALFIGVAMGLLRVSRSLFNRLLGGIYVAFVRNVPPLVLIFIFYYFISSQIMPRLGIDEMVRDLSPGTRSVLTFLFASPKHFTTFLSALVTLALFEGAYITEIVRSGIESIERGQWEASSALGMNRFQQMRHVIVPQAARIALPPLAGQFISTIKDSAIVSVISIQELTFQAMELMAATYMTFEVWITVTAMYLILTLSCSLAVGGLERYVGRRAA